MDLENNRISRETFIVNFGPMYKAYFPQFRYTGGLKSTVNNYIDESYPDTVPFLGIFRRRIFFDDKIDMSRKDNTYVMILANAFAIHRFLKFYEYVRRSESCVSVQTSFMSEYFSLELNPTVLHGIDIDNSNYSEWNDIFGFYQMLQTTLNISEQTI